MLVVKCFVCLFVFKIFIITLQKSLKVFSVVIYKIYSVVFSRCDLLYIFWKGFWCQSMRKVSYHSKTLLHGKQAMICEATY